MDAVERAAAIKEIAVQHESDCGVPGVFTHVGEAAGTWTAVIEHYDPEKPLERVGKPCRYSARHDWQVSA